MMCDFLRGIIYMFTIYFARYFKRKETINLKYCVHCGSEILYDDAVICIKCGRSVDQQRTPVTVKKDDDTINIIVKIFLIMGCIAQGWLLIPLAWCLPITISIFNSFRDKRPISTGVKVCALLFVNLIAGICLLCMNDDP